MHHCFHKKKVSIRKIIIRKVSRGAAYLHILNEKIQSFKQKFKYILKYKTV